MQKRFDAARGRAARCCATSGRLTADGKATVGVAELDKKHAFANIALTDNVVRYATARYNNNPLIVQGPGAGPEVTAAGVFADLLRVCSLSRGAACEQLTKATAFAPASVGNVAIGFDILGFSVDVLGDSVHGRRARDKPGVRDHRRYAASSSDMPREPEKNTAGRALLAHAARR